MRHSADGNEPRRTRAQRTRWSTQDAAWHEIQPALSGIGARVFDAILSSPATCDELEARLDLTHQTCSAAVNKLMRDGRIVADGSRPTRSGRSARVWRVSMPESLFPFSLGAA